MTAYRQKVDEGPQPLDGRTTATCRHCGEALDVRRITGYSNTVFADADAWCRASSDDDDDAAEVCTKAGVYWHEALPAVPDLADPDALEAWLD